MAEAPEDKPKVDLSETEQARIAWEAEQDRHGVYNTGIHKTARAFYREAGWTDVENGVEYVTQGLIADQILEIGMAAEVDDNVDIQRIGASRASVMARLFPGLPEHDSHDWHDWDDDSREAWETVAAEVWRWAGQAAMINAAEADGLTWVKTKGSKDAVSVIYVTRSEPVVLGGPAAEMAAKAIKAQEKFAKDISRIARRHPDMLPALERLQKRTIGAGAKAAEAKLDETKALVGDAKATA